MFDLRPHPDARKAAKGFKLGVVDAVARQPAPPPLPRDIPRRALIDEQPDFLTVNTGFERIVVADGLNFASVSAWYPLLDLPIDVLGQEVVLNSVTVEMTSPDILGVWNADPQALAWGSSNLSGGALAPQDGRGAVLVIGTDLPTIHPIDPWFNAVGIAGSEPPEFNGAQFRHPGFDGGNQAPITDQSHLFRMKFPPGKLTDTLPFDRVIPKTFGLYGRPLGFGTRLGVAIVFKAGTIVNSSGDEKYIYGHCNVQLHLGLTRQRGQFNNKL